MIDTSTGFLLGIGFTLIINHYLELKKVYAKTITNKFENKLDQKPIFIKCYEPYDWSNIRDQRGLELTYTNGHTQMFTTPDEWKHHDLNPLESEAEFNELLNYIISLSIPRKLQK